MDDVFETIEAYINGNLSPEERRAFEERLKTDAQLAETFKLYQGIESSMRNEPAAEEAALKKSLQQLNEKYFPPKQAVTRSMFTNWRAVAALCIVVAGAALWLVLSKGDDNISPREVYSKYALHSPIDNSSRSITIDSLPVRAAREFNNRNYTEALVLIKQYLKREPDDAEMELASGIAYLELDSLTQAKNIFSYYAATKQTTYTYKAQWYLALSFLKEGNYIECKKALAVIPKDAEEYEKAQELLKELK